MLSAKEWVANSITRTTKSRSFSRSGRVFAVAVAIAIATSVAAAFFDVGVPAAILLATVTIVGGFVSQLFLSAQQHQRAIELKIQEQNAGPYREFIDLWFDVLNRQMLQQKPMSRAELIPKMSKLSNPLLLWSSNDFVHAYNDFRRLSARAEKLPDAPPHVKTLFVFEDMLVVMREGMGHSSEGLGAANCCRSL